MQQSENFDLATKMRVKKWFHVPSMSLSRGPPRSRIRSYFAVGALLPLWHKATQVYRCRMLERHHIRLRLPRILAPSGLKIIWPNTDVHVAVNRIVLPERVKSPTVLLQTFEPWFAKLESLIVPEEGATHI